MRMDPTVTKIIKEMIANSSNGLIKKSYIKGIQCWKDSYTFFYKDKQYRFMKNDKKIYEIDY